MKTRHKKPAASDRTVTLKFPTRSMGKTIIPDWSEFPAVRAQQFRTMHLQGAYLRVQLIPGDLPRMTELTRGFGSLAHLVGNASFPKAKGEFLRKIAGHCMGWAKALQPHQDVFKLVHNERHAQRDAFNAGIHPFDIANPRGDEALKLIVLTEEVGEVADAVQTVMKAEQKLAMLNHERHRLAVIRAVDALCNELIQVAAVCLAWLEAITPVKGGAR